MVPSSDPTKVRKPGEKNKYILLRTGRIKDQIVFSGRSDVLIDVCKM